MALIQILHDNLFAKGTLKASSTASGSDPRNAIDHGTWSAWISDPGTVHSLVVNLGNGIQLPAEVIALYGLDLGNSHRIRVQSSNTLVPPELDDDEKKSWIPPDQDWVDHITHLQGAEILAGHIGDVDGGAWWFPFAAQTAQWWRIIVDGGNGDPFAATISVAYLGTPFTTDIGTQVGQVPPHLAREVDAINLASEGGALLGRTVLNRGYAFSIGLDHLEPLWVETTWLPFITHAEQAPFFLNWGPLSALGRTMFCWVEGQIPKPDYHHPRWMKAGLNVRGLR